MLTKTISRGIINRGVFVQPALKVFSSNEAAQTSLSDIKDILKVSYTEEFD